MFTFPVSPSDLFNERTVQMRGWGIPARTIERVRRNIEDTWREGPGGWTEEWVREALVYEKKEKWLLASLCYGAARFPCAVTPSRQAAQKRQIETYLLAAKSFPCRFERRVLRVRTDGQDTEVPIHLFSRKSVKHRPIVILSGGVDTYKVELHRLALALALGGDFLVASLDMPGSGESKLQLTASADAVYLEVLKALQRESASPCKTAILGVSFGAHWAAKLGLRGLVDAAVNIGGPVGHLLLDAQFLSRLPNGMPGIIANAVGLDELPTGDRADALLKQYSLREQGLFAALAQTPILVINGTNDPYIPPEETTVFKTLPQATVWQVVDTTHCAAEKFKQILPSIVVWLRQQLHEPRFSTRFMGYAARAVFPKTI